MLSDSKGIQIAKDVVNKSISPYWDVVRTFVYIGNNKKTSSFELKLPIAKMLVFPNSFVILLST